MIAFILWYVNSVVVKTLSFQSYLMMLAHRFARIATTMKQEELAKIDD